MGQRLPDIPARLGAVGHHDEGRAGPAQRHRAEADRKRRGQQPGEGRVRGCIPPRARTRVPNWLASASSSCASVDRALDDQDLAKRQVAAALAV